MSKRALITGITGMDGSHLADLLLSKNYKVYGLDRWHSNNNYININHILKDIELLKGDMADQNSLKRCLDFCQPDEVYNFASQSFVGESWQLPEYTCDITGLGVLRILDAIREINKKIKFYQASSSEMFGKTDQFLNETSVMNPASPYGVAKLFGHSITKNYRESHDIFAVSGILFNHESERRGAQFVTRKITLGVAKIFLGLIDKICLGNINSIRDWGYAPDYVKGIWLMLQQDQPDDYILATGETKTIKDFLKVAFSCVDIQNWEDYIAIDEKLFRPVDVDFLWGDAKKAKENLKWQPETKFEVWVNKMVQHDIRLLSGK